MNEARAQDTQLPTLTVEGTKPAAKKKAAKKAPAAVAPTALEAAPATTPTTAKAEAVEPADVPYTVPAGVSVVGSSEIGTFGQARLDNVIRTMPGTFTRESTNNAGVAVNIRGFEGSGRVNTMIDGVRQNFRFTGHEAQGFTYIDPLLVAGIEVQRGAVSTAGGAGALAGTANFRTLGVEDILKPGQKEGVLSIGSWGSNSLGWSGMAAGAITNGSVGIAGAISGHNEDDYKNGEGVTVPFTFEEPTSGLVKADFYLDEEQSLKFGGVFYDNDFLANSYFQHVKSNTFTAKYAYNPIDNDLINFSLNGYRNEVSMQYGTDFKPSNGVGSSAGRYIEDDGWGFDISNMSRFNIGAVRVKSVYGYEYFFDDVEATNKVNPSLEGGVNPSGKSSIGSPFSETTFSYGIFDLIGGLRFDQYALEGSGAALAYGPGVVTPPGTPVGTLIPYTVDRDDQRLSPKITLAATPLPWLQPYITYSESMRAPTISETLTGGIHPQSFGMNFAPNPFLDPEIQKGWEFGFNIRENGILQRGDALRLKADYFTMDVDNYITTCLTGGPGGVYAFYCNARGTSQVDGVEVQATYDAGYAFGGVTYTYTNTNLPTQLNGFGAQSYLPDSILTLTGGVRALSEKLTLGARGYIVSESYNGADQVRALLGPFAPNPNGDPNDPYNKPYELLDLFANYRLDSGVDVGMTVTNVFDRAYTPALSTGGTDFTGETGRGRTFLLTTRAQF